MNKTKGFTLIELLVVIAIIGLLSTLAVISLGNARAKARDSKRISDIKQLQTALELYYNDNSHYPFAFADTAPGTPVATAYQLIGQSTVNYKCLDSIHGFAATCSGTVYMQQVPSAPTPIDKPSGTVCEDRSDNYYSYYVDNATAPSTYQLKYCTGGTSGGVPAGVHTATPAGIQ